MAKPDLQPPVDPLLPEPISEHREPVLWQMLALVAGLVAAVILIFAVIGYLLGKLVF